MYKEKVRDSSATMARNYKLCDQVTDCNKKQRRECEQELVSLLSGKRSNRRAAGIKRSHDLVPLRAACQIQNLTVSTQVDQDLHQYLPPHPAGKTAMYVINRFAPRVKVRAKKNHPKWYNSAVRHHINCVLSNGCFLMDGDKASRAILLTQPHFRHPQPFLIILIFRTLKYTPPLPVWILFTSL